MFFVKFRKKIISSSCSNIIIHLNVILCYNLPITSNGVFLVHKPIESSISSDAFEINNASSFHEDSNLPESALVSYIGRFVVDGIATNESACHQTARVTAEIAAIIFLIASRIPFINISRTFAGDETTFDDISGWFLAFCNVSSFAVLDAFCIYNIVYELIRSLSEEEQEILAFDSYRKIDVVLRIIAIAIASIAVIPHAYVSYEYNNQSIAMALLAAAGCIPVPANSLFLSLSEGKKNRCLSPIEQDILDSKKKLIAYIDEFRRGLPLASTSNLERIISDFRTIQGLDTSIEKTNGLMEFIFREQPEVQDPPSKLRFCGKKCAEVIGGGLSLSVMWYLGKIGYDFGNAISGTAAGVATGLAVAACSGYLTFDLLINATSCYYDMGVDLFTQKKPESWGHRVYPKITLALKLLVLTINGFAFAPTVQVVEDHFDGIPKDFLEVAAPLSFFIICSYLSLMLIDEIMEKCTQKFGSESQREIITIGKRLNELSALLKQSPLIEFAKMRNILSPDVISQWQLKLTLVSDKLTTITEHTPIIQSS